MSLFQDFVNTLTQQQPSAQIKPVAQAKTDILGGVKNVINKVANTKIPTSAVPFVGPALSKIAPTFTPKSVGKEVLSTGQSVLKSAADVSASLPNSPLKSPLVQAGMKTPLGQKIVSTAFGGQPESLQSQAKRGVTIPLVNKKVSGVAALPLVAAGAAINLSPFGGEDKLAGEEAIKLAKTATTSEDFARLLKGTKAEGFVTKLINDTKSPVNSAVDFFNQAKGGTTPVVKAGLSAVAKFDPNNNPIFKSLDKGALRTYGKDIADAGTGMYRKPGKIGEELIAGSPQGYKQLGVLNVSSLKQGVRADSARVLDALQEGKWDDPVARLQRIRADLKSKGTPEGNVIAKTIDDMLGGRVAEQPIADTSKTIKNTMNNEDLQAGLKAVENFNNNKADLKYATGTGIEDVKTLRYLGEKYIGKDFAKNVPDDQLAQEVTNFIRDQQGKPAVNLDNALPIENTQPIKEPTGVASEILNAVKAAKPLRKEQQALYATEQGKRFNQAEQAFQTGGGEAGARAAMGKLGGEFTKVAYEPIQLSQETRNIAYEAISKAKITTGEKASAIGGLDNMIKGSIPTDSQLAPLGKVFGEDLVKGLVEKRSLAEKVKTGIEDVLNIPRSLMSSVDVSASGRQALPVLGGHPKRYAQAFIGQFKQMINQGKFDEVQKAITEHPDYQLAQEGGLALTDLGQFGVNREEAFRSPLAEKIPGVGRVVKASGRAYTGMLNPLRMNLFSDFIRNGEKAGRSRTDLKWVQETAALVNDLTGRGELPKTLKGAAGIMNAGIFSPRLVMSRVNLLNPVHYIRMDSQVRKEAARAMIGFAGMVGTVLLIAKARGADVETDPTSADFGKAKIGDTRYDMTGGFGAYIRLIAQLQQQRVKSSTTGKSLKLGVGYKPMNSVDIVQRFFENKAAPVASFGLGYARGVNTIGQPFDVKQETMNRFIPMVIQDYQDALQEYSPSESAVRTAPSIFGIGTQTYSGKTTAKSRIGTRIGRRLSK